MNKQVINSFTLLRQSFVRTTVPANVTAFQADLDSRIDRYNNQETEADPAKQTTPLPIKDEHKLNPLFAKFCEDGITFFESNECKETAEKYQSAISDYLFMKERQTIEWQIMEANRVGVEKNLSNIIA